jgi:hypothetical protein
VTVETRTAIEPQDILGIEIACAKCNFRCTRTVKEFYDVKIACPNCDASWTHLREDFDRLSKLADVLRRLSSRDDKSVVIRLETAQPQPNK